MVKLMKVKDIKKYYEQLNIGITMSTMWSTLQTKSEYGSNRSEKGYQQVAKSMAGNIARGLKLNSDLAEILTVCKGAFFPVKGKEGMKCIRQYMEKNNLQMSDADFARNFVEYDLHQSGNIITPEFDSMLQELFDEGKKSDVAEVQIANICHESIENMKKVERYSTIKPADLLYNFSKDIEKESIRAGKPTSSKKLTELIKSIPEKSEEISEEEKKQIFKDLDIFIEYTKEDKFNAIYEYIASDDLNR